MEVINPNKLKKRTAGYNNFEEGGGSDYEYYSNSDTENKKVVE